MKGRGVGWSTFRTYVLGDCPANEEEGEGVRREARRRIVWLFCEIQHRPRIYTLFACLLVVSVFLTFPALGDWGGSVRV